MPQFRDWASSVSALHAHTKLTTARLRLIQAPSFEQNLDPKQLCDADRANAPRVNGAVRTIGGSAKLPHSAALEPVAAMTRAWSAKQGTLKNSGAKSTFIGTFATAS